MLWDRYKTWLETNIIEDEETNSLRPGVAEKYEIDNEEVLVKELSNLIMSIENNGDFISSETAYKEYHALPMLADLENKAKSWSKLFPDRATTFFGEISNKKILDDMTWIVLKNIYEDWRQEETRFKKMENEFTEEFFEDLLLRGIICSNANLLKKNDFEQKLTNWLAEYNKLGKRKQEEAKENKEKVEKMLQFLNEVKEETTENNGWWNSNRKTILWTVGGTLLVLFLVYLLKRFLLK